MAAGHGTLPVWAALVFYGHLIGWGRLARTPALIIGDHGSTPPSSFVTGVYIASGIGATDGDNGMYE